MTKSTISNPTRTRKAAKTTNGRTRTRAKPAAGAKSKPPAKTKKQICIDLLKRPKGASVGELQKATGWQAHSVRAVLSRFRKSGTDVTRTVGADGKSRYRTAKSRRVQKTPAKA